MAYRNVLGTQDVEVLMDKGMRAKQQVAARVCVLASVLISWVAVFAASCDGRPQLLFSALRLTLGVSVFIVLSAGCIPERGICGPSDEAPPATIRTLCAFVLLAVGIIGTSYPWATGLAMDPLCEHWYDSSVNVGMPWGQRELRKNWGVFVIDAIACWTTGALAMFCIASAHQPSRFIRNAVCFMTAVWFEGFCFMVGDGLVLCGDPSSALVVDGRSSSQDVGFFVDAVNATWVGFLIFRRVRELERTFGGVATPRRWVLPLFSSSPSMQLGVFLGITQGLRVIANLFTTMALNHGISALDNKTAWPMLLACCTMGLCLLHMLDAFAEPLRVLASEAAGASPAPAAEALWAWQSLRFERDVIVLSMTWSMCDLGLRSFMGFFPEFTQTDSTPLFLTYCLIMDVRGFIDVISIAMLCGFLCSKAEDRSLSCATFVSTSTMDTFQVTRESSEGEGGGMARHPASGDPGWSEKVEELASRGLELSRLLDFLEGLLRGRVMPSFDPRRSTTNDVVRQAIIPLSREQPPLCGGRALATVWSGGEAVWPERMVTHSWSNLFLHLVAAIVCDALGEALYYEGVAEQLCSLAGVERVRSRLRSLNALSFTYWVCAFSVNQHAGICGGFGDAPPMGSTDRAVWERKRVDTASGQPHAVCACRQPKFFSDQPVQCEMNKFDDMLDLLMRSMPGFRQVIAMDRNFDLLRRCWCLAEIVRTSAARMPQNTLMLSAEAMDEHYGLLATLDVRDCQASHPEDRDFILGKIHSVERFNARLQRLVFSSDGIFNRQLADPRDRVHAAARVAARVVKMRTTSPPRPQPRPTGSSPGPAAGGGRRLWRCAWPPLWRSTRCSSKTGCRDGGESNGAENGDAEASNANSVSPFSSGGSSPGFGT